MTVSAILRSGPSESAATIGELSTGDPFLMLDDTLGWAWGYAGDEGRVGYVNSEAISQRLPS